LRIERLRGSASRAEEVVRPLLQEYVPWVGERLVNDLGVRFDDLDASVEKHQQAFRRELPGLLAAGGRLLVAHPSDGEVLGMGALKPVGADIAEIKRMYVRPSARGKGIGRALLEQLLADARLEGYRLARLETLTFMTAARALYRSLGFRGTAMFDQSETAMSGLEGVTHFMELPLQPANMDPSGEPGRGARNGGP